MAKPKFAIYQIGDRGDLKIEEDNGRFDKYWISHHQLGRCLFKNASQIDSKPDQQRMDWREKVAYELGKLIGLPMAQTEFASKSISEKDVQISGSISVDYTPNGSQTMSLRSFLSQVDPNYDCAYSDSYEDGYSVENVMYYLQQNSVGLPPSWEGIEGIDDGVDLLVGYLLLDTWLGATDRHDENLEIAISETGYTLCPSFDHGDCLGSKLPLLEQVVNFKDPRLSESCWWQTQDIDGRLETIEATTLEAFNNACQNRAISAKSWLDKLAAITYLQINEIFDRIPEGRITPVAAKFAKELLQFNQNELLKNSELVLSESLEMADSPAPDD
jgi:hypothetical protein